MRFFDSLWPYTWLWPRAVAKEEADPLIVANRLFKSSKGAPVLLIVLLTSALDNRPTFGGLMIGVRVEESVDFRDLDVAVVTIESLDKRGAYSEAILRVLRKTVCGTTPSFWSSISPMTLRFFPVSGSELKRDEKLYEFNTKGLTTM